MALRVIRDGHRAGLRRYATVRTRRAGGASRRRATTAFSGELILLSLGLADTPRIGPRQTPITFELLAPNGRPVQVTQDLRSFWTNTYAVRKQLRGRYPKHPWPEDPWRAKATHRTKKRSS